MSTTIDQRVVEMEFDNSKFESNVKTSMSTIEKLKESLNFSGSTKGLENINSAVQNVNMSGLGSAVEAVKTKFSALEVIGVTALANITNSAVNAGKQLLSSLTVDNISSGWEKFGENTKNTGTLISQGFDLDEVEEQLDRLLWYTDETSYNYTDMVSNIAKFTAAGQGLEDSVTAMMGIANWAALSGQNATTASQAMYQLSQAMSSGAMRLQDWKSVETANMNTVEFMQNCIDAGVALGTLKDNLDGTYTSLVGTTDAFSATQGFRDSLTQGAWLTSEVMMETFETYSSVVDDIYEYTEEHGVTASEAIEELGDDLDEFGLKAFKAGQEARTWADAVDSVKDALSTAFMNTFQLIFGDYEEATALWTSLANTMYDIFVEPVNSLNKLLKGALGENNPFSGLMETIENVTGATEAMTEVTKDYGSIVDEVLNGDYGNGQSRWDALTEAGYDWAYVQNLVNERLGDATRHATDFEEAQGELSEASQITIEDLTKMSEAELKNLGFTEDEIQAFKDLAEQSEKTGISITDLMEDTDQLSGRALLLDGFANIGQALLDVFSAIGKAWRDVFPATTSEQLYNIIAAFHKFTTYLEMHEETLEKVERTFRGLFSILDIIKTIVGSVLSVAFSVLSGVLGECNISILDITANIGDVIYNFSQWLKENDRLTNAIKAGADILVNFIKKIKELIEAFLELPKVSAAIDGLKDRLVGLKDIGVNVIEGLKNGLEDGTLTISKIMVSIGTAILETLKTVLGIHSPSVRAFEIAWNFILGIINAFKEGIKLIASWVSKMGSTLLEGFGNIDWSKVFAGGMSVALLFVVKKLIDVYQNFVTLESGLGKTLSGIGDTLSGFGKVLSTSAKSISKTIKSISKVIKAYSFNVRTDGIKNLAIALGILVAAVVALTLVNQDKLWEAEKVVITLAGVLALLAMCVTKMSESAVTINKAGITINSLIPKLSGIASAVLMMAVVMKIVGSLDPDQFEQGVVGLAGAAGMLVTIVFAFEVIGGMGTGGMNKAGKTMLALSAALGIMAVVIKIIGTINDWTVFGKAAALITEFMIFASAMVIIGNLSSEKTWAKVGSTILALSTALTLMAVTLKLLEGTNWSAFGKGAALVSGFMIFASAMVIIGNLSSGKTWAKVGTTLLAMSAALGVMATIAIVLSLIDVSGLVKGVAAVTVLGLVMRSMIKATANAKDCKGSMMAMAIAIGVMAVAVAGLSFISVEKLVGPVMAISILMGMFALMAKGASDVKTSVATISVMVGAIALLGIVMFALKGMPCKTALAVAGSLSGVLLALAGSLRIINGVKGITKTARIALGMMMGALAEMGVILYFVKDTPAGRALASAVSIGIVLLALAESLKMLSGVKGITKTARIALGMMMGALAEMGVILYFVKDTPWNTALAASAGISLVLVALAESLRILDGVKDISLSARITLGIMLIVLAEVGATLYLVKDMPWSTALAASGGISLVLLALAASLKIISGVQSVSVSAMVAVVLLGAIVAVLAVILGQIGTLEVGSTLAIAASLSTMLIAMSVVCVILGAVGSIGTAAIEGAGILVAVIAIIAVIATAMGALIDLLGAGDAFESGCVMIERLGTCIGTFLGNIIGGFTSGATSGLGDIGTHLSEFVENAQSFFETVSGLDTDAINGVKNLADMVLTLTKADFIDGLTFWNGSESSLSAFGDELGLFGPKMKAYADSVDGIDSEAVLASANAALALGDLAKEIPTEGGLFAMFAGDSNLETWGLQLEAFGASLAAYSDAITGEGELDIDAINTSVEAALALSDLAKEIPNEGGLLAMFAGDNNIETWGSQLEAFGASLAAYSDAITGEGEGGGGLDIDAINTSVEAGMALSDLAEEIPNEGGLLGMFAGNNNIETWGSQLEAFGTSLVAYSTTVAGIDSDALTSSTEQFSKLVDLTNDIGTVDYTKVSGFSESLRILGNSGVTGFVSAFECSEEQVTSAVNTMVGYVDTAVTAYQNQNDDIAGMGALATTMITELENSSESFETTGSSLIASLLQGISGKVQSVQASCKAVMNLAISAIKEKHSDVTDAGDYIAKGLIDGLVKGITDRISEVEGAIDTLSDDTIEELREVLGIHSPSTITELIGEFLDSGLIQGIKNKAGDVTGTAKSLASSVIDVFQTVSTDGLSGITDSLSSGLDDYISTLTDGVFDVSELQDYFVDYTGSTVSDTEDLQQTSIEDEKGYWAELLKIKRQGADAEKYLTMSVAEFQEDILSQTAEIWQNYIDEWSNATDTLMNKSSIFSEVSEQETVSADTLTQNLKDQIEQVKQYTEVMASLNTRITDVDLKEVINDMGVDSLAELQALNSMTDAQLTDYVNLYNEKYALCQTAAATQMSSLQTTTEQQLSELFGGVDVNLQEFATSFDGTFASINQYVATAIETGAQIAAGVGQGITEGTEASTLAAADMIDQTEQAARDAALIQSPSQLFADEVGSYIGQGVGVGMCDENAMIAIHNGATAIIRSAVTVLRNSRSSFVSAGAYVADGFKEGFISKINEIAAAAAEMAHAAYEAACNALEVASPSRKFKRIGEYVDEGFIIGLNAYAGKVENAASSVANDALDSFSSTISDISNVISDDLDAQPVIAPVLDLTDVKAGAGELSSLLSRDSALSISSIMSENASSSKFQNDGDSEAKGNTFNYTQNNYSPKALSRIEIYRQTKNQFSALKGALT